MRKTLLSGVAVLALTAAASFLHMIQAGNAPAAQVSVGGKVSNVTLSNLAGETVYLYDFAGPKGALALFVSTRCPVSNDYNQRMAELARDYTARGFAVIGINSNRNEPADEVARHVQEKALGFPVLKDPSNRVADYLGASVTPEAYLFTPDWTLVYWGRIDDSRNPAGIGTRDLRAALDAIAGGKAVPVAQTKAFGCTIKRVSAGS